MSSGTRAKDTAGVRRPLRDESIRDSTLIENLDGARVQTAGARAGESLALPELDDRDADPRQGQLASQHQPSRAPAGNHHRVLGHIHLATVQHPVDDPTQDEAMDAAVTGKAAAAG
jgi:hypothetical protein